MRRVHAVASVEFILVPLLILLCASSASGEIACARGGVVSSACPVATSVGVEVLKRGGNAIDASVAVGFALAVTYPQAGNIGGGGFMLLHRPSGESLFIDFRERAPFAAHRDMYIGADGEVIENASLIGAMASGVPGSVAGLFRAHSLGGSMSWKELLAPAISLASEGFPVSERLAASLAGLRPFIERFEGLRQFVRADGSALEPGDTLRQPDLARTLELIAEGGADAFYRGAVADLIVAEMEAGDGLVSREDLAAYEPKVRKPVQGTYRGYGIISAPPPSSGGSVLIEILNVLECFDLAGMGFHSDRSIHYIAEAERRAYADRARHLGDPDFVKNPVRTLTSKKYARKLAERIEPRATPSSALAEPPGGDREKAETTHYSVVDRFGNAVATTTTLNDSYGSRLLVRGGGFLLNNEMDDFSLKPGVPNLYGLVGSEANEIAPGKRMLSSMSPTIVTKDGKARFLIGTPGGSTIITTVAQVILNVIDYGMTLEAAVAAPRFHHQWLPDRISFERGMLTLYMRGFLEERGHRIEERGTPIGDVQAIEIRQGCACGVPDPRGGGAAGGVEPVEAEQE